MLPSVFAVHILLFFLLYTTEAGKNPQRDDIFYKKQFTAGCVQKVKSVNEACDSQLNDACKPGLYCSPRTNTCQHPKAGQICTEDRDCGSDPEAPWRNCIDGNCDIFRPDSFPCTKNSHCQSNICNFTSNTCSGYLEGQGCDPGSLNQCKDGFFCSSRDPIGSYEGRCTRQLGLVHLATTYGVLAHFFKAPLN
eukprot:TRINITY_DN3694_c0_g1_i1.p1 TRINITY_DN3694_c0_g1~~TRINITY_DN3694_c0_g1_i1.p1  ORF type:complete len:193 (+),score=9.53 TRINITY_DN3694_c0_g1_i1:43-621(+)